MITIIPMVAMLMLQICFRIKKDGTPRSAAMPKQMSCLLVILNTILSSTCVRSRGTGIYAAICKISFPHLALNTLFDTSYVFISVKHRRTVYPMIPQMVEMISDEIVMV